MATAIATAPASSATADDFAALYAAAHADVHAYVATLLRDAHAAEDVTAIAFERALRRRHSFDARRGSRRAWLFGIARNAALDELRRRGRQAQPALDDEAGVDVAAPGDEAQAATDRATIDAAVSTLDPRDRELIALKFHGGLGNAEIGRVLGISESNAGTKLHRAVRRLREACDATA